MSDYTNDPLNDPLAPPPGTVVTVPPDPSTSGTPSGSKADAAKAAAADTAGAASEKGREVAHTAAGQAKGVAAEARSQAGTVVEEARTQARQVMGTAGSELQNQLADRLQTASGGARDTAGQLRALADGRVEEAGQVGDLARKAGDQLERLADRADELGVQGVVEEVSEFARRRPVAFLAGAAAAGFLVGRLARAGKEVAGSDGSGAGTTPGLSDRSATVHLTSPEPVVTTTYDPTLSTTPGITPGATVPATAGPGTPGGGYGEVR